MKLMRILLFSVIFVSSAFNAKSQQLVARVGAYDFTDYAAHKFYLAVPSFYTGIDVWQKLRFGIRLQTGLSYSSFKYNASRHKLYMVPLMATMKYEVFNSDSRAWPFIGAGVSMMGKADQNKSFNKTYVSLSYGYHVIGGFAYRINESTCFTFDLTYNFLHTPSLEDVNLKGVIVAAGICYKIRRRGN